MEHFDFVVVGAGWFGLAQAKTHHQLHPSSSVLVLDAAATVGGVWAAHHLYPGLKSNNLLGTYEYPDFPMDPATFGVQPGEHIPGEVLHKYLVAYADKFGISDKIRLNTQVVSVEHQPAGGWVVTIVPSSSSASAAKKLPETKILAKKLVVATGLTSEAFLPDFAGQETFGAPIFHTKDFLSNAETIENAKEVTVFGGAKSAWDAVYAYATKGVKVNWVMRKTGHGPMWMSPPYVTPLKKWLEKLVNTRMLTWFSPCVWADVDGYSGIRSFYHGTFIGRAIVNAFWSILGNDVLTLNNYAGHPETAKLKPWSHPMFTASSFSILNYDTNFFDLVRAGTVKVFIEDIAGLADHTVKLTDGTELRSDALVCATGWKKITPFKLLPEGIEVELGLPHTPDPNVFPSSAQVDKADAEILARFPRLRDQPVQNASLVPMTESAGISSSDAINPSTKLTPFTLHRFIVPASVSQLREHRDIAFAGFVMNFSVSCMAHLQGLWIDAYFNWQLPSLAALDRPISNGEEDEAFAKLQYETVLYSRFGHWRYPAGHGDRVPDMVFDAVSYLDLMLTDLGLPVHRKGGWLAEATSPYGPEDYKDVVAEWAEKVGKLSQ